jgi:hypothetical protein
MGRRYSATCSAVTNTAAKTIFSLITSTSTRPQIYDLVISAGGVAPADHAAEYQLKRFTADGTGTAGSVVALDPGDPAALASTKNAYTAEPTYTASTVLLDIGVNMRATFRWVARERSEIILPATSGNGVGYLVNAVDSAFATNFMQLHEE